MNQKTQRRCGTCTWHSWDFDKCIKKGYTTSLDDVCERHETDEEWRRATFGEEDEWWQRVFGENMPK